MGVGQLHNKGGHGAPQVLVLLPQQSALFGTQYTNMHTKAVFLLQSHVTLLSTLRKLLVSATRHAQPNLPGFGVTPSLPVFGTKSSSRER